MIASANTTRVHVLCKICSTSVRYLGRHTLPVKGRFGYRLAAKSLRPYNASCTMHIRPMHHVDVACVGRPSFALSHTLRNTTIGVDRK